VRKILGGYQVTAPHHHLGGKYVLQGNLNGRPYYVGTDLPTRYLYYDKPSQDWRIADDIKAPQRYYADTNCVPGRDSCFDPSCAMPACANWGSYDPPIDLPIIIAPRK
jgi:hypothetical protein